jgi:hypothetical protein
VKFLSSVVRGSWLGLAVCLWFAGTSTAGGQQDWSGFLDPLPPERLETLRETDPAAVEVKSDGRSELSWEPLPAADGYRVRGPEELVFYEGRLSRAFVSGLPDGDHRFVVEALDKEGNVIATGPQSTVVVVEHWKLSTALGLMIVGGLVFLGVIGLLLAGVLRARTARGKAGA